MKAVSALVAALCILGCVWARPILAATDLQLIASSKGHLVVKEFYAPGDVKTPDGKGLRLEPVVFSAPAILRDRKAYGFKLSQLIRVQVNGAVQHRPSRWVWLDYDESVSLSAALGKLLELGQRPAEGGRSTTEADFNTKSGLVFSFIRDEKEPTGTVRLDMLPQYEGDDITLSLADVRELRTMLDKGLSRLRELGAKEE
jgi:hypothetical protein